MPTSAPQKKPALQDWHPADVKREIDKAGWSLRQLGFHHGYTGDSSLCEVLRRPWPKVERIIAETIGRRPEEIWPSRYDTAGKPNRLGGRQPKRPSHIKLVKPTTGGAARNPQKRACA